MAAIGWFTWTADDDVEIGGGFVAVVPSSIPKNRDLTDGKEFHRGDRTETTKHVATKGIRLYKSFLKMQPAENSRLAQLH
jgi:hypothetical protein